MKWLAISLILWVGLMTQVNSGKPRKEQSTKYKNSNQAKGFENKKWTRDNQKRETGKYNGGKPYVKEYKKGYEANRYQYREKKDFNKGWKNQEKKDTKNSEQVTQPKQPKCDVKAVYDQNILVLVWPIEYCEEAGDCNTQWEDQWDSQTPILRGFWPAGSDEYFYNCFGFQQDHHCRENAYQPDFEIQFFFANDSALLKKIDKFWSPFHSGDGSEFYKREWVTHGMCYLMNMIEDNPKSYEADPSAFNRTILTQYFKNGIQKAQKLSISLSSADEYLSKEQFAQVIGFEGKEDHFNLVCGKDNQVDQIHICYNRTRVPGKETTVTCPNYDSCAQYPKFKFR